ncbi:hypothetical protein [uncultured Mailhella sp.]|uniref:hypothetical protein n=1 Tax=uncultured Mailhella sp. TaxID=1981031 RepID=UPI0025DE6446|nr:hypothetical protein [uncultured Mailhella sp.]
MPINLDHFFQHVSTLDDSLQFHVSASQDLAQGTALHGLKKLSSDARAVENQAAVRAFVQSLSQNPVYGALLDRVRTPLDAFVKAGKPLTAGVVKQTQLALNVILASQVGTSLVNGGQLPADHGAAFGQFAALHGMPLARRRKSPAPCGNTCSPKCATRTSPRSRPCRTWEKRARRQRRSWTGCTSLFPGATAFWAWPSIRHFPRVWTSSSFPASPPPMPGPARPTCIFCSP